MGCDIHWILEQRHPDGAWHAIHSKSRAYDSFDNSLEKIDSRPDLRLGQRNYRIFGLLSNVRCPAGKGGSLLAPGFPADLSDYAQVTCDSWGNDWHSHGHLTADMLEGRPIPNEIRPWLDLLFQIVAAKDGAPALMPRNREKDWAPESPDAPPGFRASAHARAAAALRGQEAKGGPWRLLVAYDN